MFPEFPQFRRKWSHDQEGYVAMEFGPTIDPLENHVSFCFFRVGDP